MTRAEQIAALKQELMRHVDRRIAEVLGERLPVALFLFDGDEAHAVCSGEWEATRAALADWAEGERDPTMTFPLQVN
ncbi:hypothetical protein [Parvibaculum sp.]|uniref:hypothetical protein n=1 Tax=Parvibaculum sp. TaxID=2024848 RepID=UPI00272F67D7|nr:hypothetical protein [Parvibaculum sp.]MDP1628818.1 hypothetical protein [Parvibaculum sp.]MDP2148213.1 hypothetical protein [Parvibaculum sp.]MDP3327725.1 hypothetical protein [Parvibaculum sp.]